MVFSPFQSNQLAVIEALSKSLPFGMDLVLKEHPTMVGFRPSGFYDALGRMPKVSLASPFENTFALMRQADLICTITGTAGWEAILLRKPVLVIGEMVPYLCLGQGLEHCPELTGLRMAILSALNRPPASEECLELFLASILNQSFDLPASVYWTNISRKQIENHKDILKNICDYLQNAPGGQSL